MEHIASALVVSSMPFFRARFGNCLLLSCFRLQLARTKLNRCTKKFLNLNLFEDFLARDSQFTRKMPLCHEEFYLNRDGSIYSLVKYLCHIWNLPKCKGLALRFFMLHYLVKDGKVPLSLNGLFDAFHSYSVSCW